MFQLVICEHLYAGQSNYPLEAESKKQAVMIGNLQANTLANNRAHNQLVQHFQELKAQVLLNTKSQELLHKLSGMGANPTTKHFTLGIYCCLLHAKQCFCFVFMLQSPFSCLCFFFLCWLLTSCISICSLVVRWHAAVLWITCSPFLAVLQHS